MDPGVDELSAAIRGGDRAALGRALSIVESTRPEDRARAGRLLASLGPGPSDVRRIGVTGAPGAGKSTLIDALGMRALERGAAVAVLAVDPSSERSGGSILGDKTRMARLSRDRRAFVRPSPSRGALGGVALRTRAAMQLLEGAGYDTIFVETVGVGQSETLVASLVDTVLGLVAPASGDGLQGVKRGFMEWVDVLGVTHADGGHRSAAARTERDFRGAVRLLGHRDDGWQVRVCAVSSVTGEGLDELERALDEHRRHLGDPGKLARLRAAKRLRWMWHLVQAEIFDRLRKGAVEGARVLGWIRAVEEGRVTPEEAAEAIVAACLPAAPAGAKTP